MAPASLVLILLVTISAALMHVFWGRSWTQFVILWIAAAAGSLAIYLSGIRLPLDLGAPAGVPALEVLIGAWICLIIAIRLRS